MVLGKKGHYFRLGMGPKYVPKRRAENSPCYNNITNLKIVIAAGYTCKTVVQCQVMLLKVNGDWFIYINYPCANDVTRVVNSTHIPWSEQGTIRSGESYIAT